MPTRCETFESILHQAVFVSKVSRTPTLKAPSAGSMKSDVPGSRSRSSTTTSESHPSPALQRMKGARGRNVPKPEPQKMTFAPNCNWRGLLAVLFALPKLDRFEMSLPGVP
jgi:hypothetical protein